jgi:hypothetical protein
MPHALNEAFDEFIAGVTGPATMAELAAAFQRSTPIPDEYRDAALSACVKQDLRRAINRYRSSDGTPRLISLPDVDPEPGLHVRKYKQLDLFNREDYVKAWWMYDATEKTARRGKHALERHHDGRGIDAEPLRKIVLRGDAGQGAA